MLNTRLLTDTLTIELLDIPRGAFALPPLDPARRCRATCANATKARYVTRLTRRWRGSCCVSPRSMSKPSNYEVDSSLALVSNVSSVLEVSSRVTVGLDLSYYSPVLATA